MGRKDAKPSPTSRAVPIVGYTEPEPGDGEWEGTAVVERRKFACGYCGATTGSYEGWKNLDSGGHTVAEIVLCQNCNRPNYFEDAMQVPNAGLGKPVEHLPNKVDALYGEARRCTSVGAYTGALLLCRTLLMYVAVEKGAEPGRDFPDYMNYLASKGYTPKGAKTWVERIIRSGGEAAHEVSPKRREDAEDILTFAEMLLKNAYELPTRARKLGPIE